MSHSCWVRSSVTRKERNLSTAFERELELEEVPFFSSSIDNRVNWLPLRTYRQTADVKNKHCNAAENQSVDGRPVSTSRVDGPCNQKALHDNALSARTVNTTQVDWWAVSSARQNRSPINSGRLLGPSTRVMETCCGTGSLYSNYNKWTL